MGSTVRRPCDGSAWKITIPSWVAPPARNRIWKSEDSLPRGVCSERLIFTAYAVEPPRFVASMGR
jgi:hypothetical protein